MAKKSKENKEIDFIVNHLPMQPFSKGCVGENANRSRESEVLMNQINYYLTKLKLPILRIGIDREAFEELSYRGDLLFKLALQPHGNNAVLAYLNSNESMKSALIRLGWHEFIDAPSHYAGTVFETIYCIANILDDERAKNILLNSVIGIGREVTKEPINKGDFLDVVDSI